jgi:hypothetical protein
VVRWHGKQHSATPLHLLVVELPSKLGPSLVENGTVQRGFLTHPLARLFDSAFGGPGNILYLQILNADERVGLAVDILPA